jgi:hypothetical protein
MVNSKSLYSRMRFFAFRAEGLLAVLVILLAMSPLAVLCTGRVALAETTRHTRTSTTTTVDSDDEGPDVTSPVSPAVPPPANQPPPRDFYETQMSQTFGSKSTTGMAGCKTEALSKDVIKDLKRECATWVKEQKKDLGKNYLGNTCEDVCDDCDMSLVRCKVTGTIRYRKNSED